MMPFYFFWEPRTWIIRVAVGTGIHAEKFDLAALAPLDEQLGVTRGVHIPVTVLTDLIDKPENTRVRFCCSQCS